MTDTPIRPFTIGGSNCAAAAGIHPHVSRIMEWLYLTGRVERPETEAMRWGKLLEPLILAQLLEDGWALESPLWNDEGYRDKERPWIIGHIDSFGVAPDEAIDDVSTRQVIEVKTQGAWSHKRNGGVPVEYAAQGQHYLHLTEMGRVTFPILVGGQRLELHTIERDQNAIDMLLTLEQDFYGYLVRDEPPAPDGSKSAREALAALYPESRGGGKMRLSAHEWELVLELRSRREQRDTVDEQVRELENRLKDAMGDAEVAVSPFDTDVLRWSDTTRTALNAKALKEHLPDLYAEYSDTTTTRRFTLL